MEGSSAPYSTIQAAVDAANAGDTIMVDGSNTEYEETFISKRLVLIGPGFWINDNGLVNEAAPSAITKLEILSAAAGTVIEGFKFDNPSNWGIKINADNCIVRRCNFYSSGSYKAISFSRDRDSNGNLTGPDPKGAVIHQNFFANSAITTYALNELMTNVQITNNIFVNNGASECDIQDITSSYIAYNTMVGGNSFWTGFASIYASTIEHNIVRLIEKEEPNENFRNELIWYPNIHIKDNNEWSDNYEMYNDFVDYKTDKDIRDAELALTGGKNYGAFAGDSPYVLSGIPAAPVIQDLVMPTTVEKGKKMNVTIKVGIQK